MSGYLTQLDLTGRRVLLVGDGDAVGVEALRLLRGGADLTVATAAHSATVQDLASRGRLCLFERRWTSEDVTAAELVVALHVDHDLRAVCRDAGCWLTERAAPTGPAATSRRGGSVTLVGGGPGDPGLLTVAGLAAVHDADVVVCDRLAPLEVLAGLDVEVVDVAKVPRGPSTSQEAINALLIERAQAGQHVVRLKGGDGYVFGRGGEEAIACAQAGVTVRVVPGVSSAVAGPALAGIPLTHRGLSQGFSVVSGHLVPGHPSSTVDYDALARTGTTIVLLMAVATLPDILEALQTAGLPGDTPAATVADAGLPSQRVVRSTVAGLADAVSAAGLAPPAITIIGDVAGLEPLVPGLHAAQAPAVPLASQLDAVERTG